MIVGSVGWAILEIFDKAVKANDCNMDCLEPYCDRPPAATALRSLLWLLKHYLFTTRPSRVDELP